MAEDNKNFELKIITPDRTFFEGEVHMVEFNTTEGQIGVYRNHIPMTVIIKPGVITITGEEVLKAALHSGFAQILQDKITILAEVIEWPDEIDKERAQAARDRAEKLIAEHKRAVRKWQRSTKPEHLPGKGDDLHGAYSGAELVDWAEKFGPQTVRGVKALLGRFEFEVQSYRPISSVLRILNRYGADAAERASEAACASSVFTVKGFKSILGAQAKLHSPARKKPVDLNDIFCAHGEEVPAHEDL